MIKGARGSNWGGKDPRQPAPIRDPSDERHHEEAQRGVRFERGVWGERGEKEGVVKGSADLLNSSAELNREHRVGKKRVGGRRPPVARS